MRIIQLTPGTGDFHCGTCIRDSALVVGLRERGHVLHAGHRPAFDGPGRRGRGPILGGRPLVVGRGSRPEGGDGDHEPDQRPQPQLDQRAGQSTYPGPIPYLLHCRKFK